MASTHAQEDGVLGSRCYLADAFFVVVFFILSTPGLFAAVLAKWLR